MQDTKHVTQAVHADEIAKILNLFYGDFGKFTNDSGNVVMSFHEKYPPSAQIFSEMQMFASGYKQATDELTTLRAQNAELKHLLFLVTAPLEKVAGNQNVPNMTADLAEEALSLIHATLAKYGDDNA